MKKAFILICICFAIQLSAQQLPAGPQVLTFFSDLDDSEQPYAIYIPKDYDAAKKYPLVVMLHGAGSNHRLALRRVFGQSNLNGETDVEASKYFPSWKDMDLIVAAPYARGTMGYQGIAEKDVMDMLADVKTRFSVDENRTYLTGLSMGGGGTLWIGLSYPDLWAAIAPVCPAPPAGTDSLAGNALNMAVRLVHGDADPVVPVSISRDWVARLTELGSRSLAYDELPGVQHDSWVGAYTEENMLEWLMQHTRDPYPSRVRHTSFDLQHGSAYWISIEKKEPGRAAMVDFTWTGENMLEGITKHVQIFSLDAKGHPMYDAGKPLKIVINGHLIEVPAGQKEHAFQQSPVRTWNSIIYRPQAMQKQSGLEGPVEDAFASRHIYVYGTGDNPDAATLKARMDTAYKAADWSLYRGEFYGRIKFYPRILADRDLRQSDHESSNLILMGNARTNSAIAAISTLLPMELLAEAEAEHGLVYVVPNTSGRYTVIQSGLPWWHVANRPGYRFVPAPVASLSVLKDFTLYGKGGILVNGYFNNDWSIPETEEYQLIDSGLVKFKE